MKDKSKLDEKKVKTFIRCEGCNEKPYVVITYINPSIGVLKERILCKEHAALIWEKLSLPLKETSTITEFNEYSFNKDKP